MSVPLAPGRRGWLPFESPLPSWGVTLRGSHPHGGTVLEVCPNRPLDITWIKEYRGVRSILPGYLASMTTDYERACWLIQAYWPHRNSDGSARIMVRTGIYRARAYRRNRRRYGHHHLLHPAERARIRHAAGVH